MSTQTPNLGLVKPADEDFYDVQVQNQNMDKIDQAVNGMKMENQTAETVLADGDYVPFYDTSATAGRKTLWSNIKAKLKTYFDTLYSTVTHTHSAYVQKSGDTMTGNVDIRKSMPVLNLRTDNTGFSQIYKNANNTSDSGSLWLDYAQDGTNAGFWVQRLGKVLSDCFNVYFDGTPYPIYHTGHKPTAADVVAMENGGLYSNGVELNNMVTSGTYRIAPPYIANKPYGAAEDAILVVESNSQDTAYMAQMYIDLTTGRVWTRVRYVGTWHEWKKLFSGVDEFDPSRYYYPDAVVSSEGKLWSFIESGLASSRAGDLLATINGRTFSKLANGTCFSCIVYDGSYTHILLVGKTPESVQFRTNNAGDSTGSTSFIYQGETWYYSGFGMSFTGDWTSTGGRTKVKLSGAGHAGDVGYWVWAFLGSIHATTPGWNSSYWATPGTVTKGTFSIPGTVNAVTTVDLYNNPEMVIVRCASTGFWSDAVLFQGNTQDMTVNANAGYTVQVNLSGNKLTITNGYNWNMAGTFNYVAYPMYGGIS